MEERTGEESAPRLGIGLTGETLLGQYAVREQIGSGGMGAVYVAEDLNLGRSVVIKVPHAQFLGETGFRERFEREVQGLIGLEHPHVVRILARGEHEGIPFVVLQHLRGGSLSERLRAAPGGRFPSAMLVPWVRTVGETLDFLHAQGLVHRDVKPGNILFDEHGNVFLSDFGIAKAVGEPDAGITNTGASVGSPLYMAPEQGRGGGLTGAADQYALAATLYEALGGRPPFENGTPLEILLRKSSDRPPDIRQRRPDLPAAAGRALMRGLAREPGRRHSSCTALVDAFDAGLGAPGALSRTQLPFGLPAGAALVRSWGDRLGTLLRRPRDRRIAAIGLASLALVVLLLVLLTRSDAAAERARALRARLGAWDGRPDADVVAGMLASARTALETAAPALQEGDDDKAGPSLDAAAKALDRADATRSVLRADLAVRTWPASASGEFSEQDARNLLEQATRRLEQSQVASALEAGRKVMEGYRRAVAGIEPAPAPATTDADRADGLAALRRLEPEVRKARSRWDEEFSRVSQAIETGGGEATPSGGEDLEPAPAPGVSSEVAGHLAALGLQHDRLVALEAGVYADGALSRLGELLAVASSLPPEEPVTLHLRAGLGRLLADAAADARDVTGWTWTADADRAASDGYAVRLPEGITAEHGEAAGESVVPLRRLVADGVQIQLRVNAREASPEGPWVPERGTYLLRARVAGDPHGRWVVLEGGTWAREDGSDSHAVLRPSAWLQGERLFDGGSPWSALRIVMTRREATAEDTTPGTDAEFASPKGGAPAMDALLDRLGGAFGAAIPGLLDRLAGLGQDRAALADDLRAARAVHAAAQQVLADAPDEALADCQLACLRATSRADEIAEGATRWDAEFLARIDRQRKQIGDLDALLSDRRWGKLVESVAGVDASLTRLQGDHARALRAIRAPSAGTVPGAPTQALDLALRPASLETLPGSGDLPLVRQAVAAGALRLRVEPDGLYALRALYAGRTLGEAGILDADGDAGTLSFRRVIDGRTPGEPHPWAGLRARVLPAEGAFAFESVSGTTSIDAPLFARIAENLRDAALPSRPFTIVGPTPSAMSDVRDVEVVIEVEDALPGLEPRAYVGKDAPDDGGVPLRRVPGTGGSVRFAGTLTLPEGNDELLRVSCGGGGVECSTQEVGVTVDLTPPRIRVDPASLDQADGAVATTDLEIHGTVLDANPRSLALRVGDGPPLPVALRQAGNGATNERPFAVTATLPAGGAAPVPVILVARDAAGHETPRTLGPFRVDPLAYHRTLAIRAAGKGPEDFATADWSAVASRLKEVQRLGGTVPAYVSDGVRKWQTPPIFRLEGKPVFQVGDPIQFNVEFRTWRYKVERLVVQEGDTQLHAKGKTQEKTLVYEAPSEKEPGYRRFFIKTTDPSVDPPEIRVQRVHEVLVLTKADFQTLRLRFQEGYQRGQIEAYTRSARPAYVKEEDWQRVIGAMAGAAQSGSATGMDLTDFLGAASALGGGRLPIPDPSGLIPRGLPFPFR